MAASSSGSARGTPPRPTARGPAGPVRRRHDGVAIIVGDPVGSPAWRSRAVAEFAAFCDRSGLVPCCFSVGSSTVDPARSLGWRHVQVAEDTLIDLGGLTEALDPRVRVGIAVDATGLVHAVTSWLPILDETGHPRGWTLDLMRRRPNGFPLAIDFLIASACLVFQSEGATVVSLSGAPLARSTRDTKGPLPRLLDGLGRIMEPCYGFRSLHAYKSKFKPRREPLYLTYPSPIALPQIGVALLRAYLARPRPVPVKPRPIAIPAPRSPQHVLEPTSVS